MGLETPRLDDRSFNDPRWFVVPCLILAGFGLLWLLAKVLKWSLWIVAAVAVTLVGVLLIASWMG